MVEIEIHFKHLCCLMGLKWSCSFVMKMLKTHIHAVHASQPSLLPALWMKATIFKFYSQSFNWFSRAQICYYIMGEQKIAKFNEAEKNTVQYHIGLFRLPQYQADILVTFNDPINIRLIFINFLLPPWEECKRPKTIWPWPICYGICMLTLFCNTTPCGHLTL